MTKEEIIKLAKEKKFVSAELCNNPYKYSSHEDMRWLFWLVEIQKWLRENHKTNVEVTRFPNIEKYGVVVTNMTIKPNTLSLREAIDMSLKVVIAEKFDIYEQALEAGIIHALKLIP